MIRFERATMGQLRALCVILGIAGLAMSAGAASAGPAMTTNWQTTALDVADCLKRGEAAMRGAGLTMNLETLQESVYGENSDFTASIRCPTGKGFVFFVVAGPQIERARKLMSELRAEF